jgi:hypothetical protein
VSAALTCERCAACRLRRVTCGCDAESCFLHTRALQGRGRGGRATRHASTGSALDQRGASCKSHRAISQHARTSERGEQQLAATACDP